MVYDFAQIADIPAGLWRWPHFTPQELACKGSGTLLIDETFLDRIERVRVACGFLMIVSSWYRSPAYNRLVAKTGDDGAHTTGCAVDIQIYGARALRLHEAAYQEGFTGFGWQQKGPQAQRYLHLDTMANRIDHPRPWIWTY